MSGVRSSTVSASSSTASSVSTASRRSSVLPPGVSQEDAEALAQLIAQSFDQAQRSSASHRKVVVSLRNVQLKASKHGLEQLFNGIFASMVNRVLPVKRFEPAAERVVGFCEAFVALGMSQDGDAEDTVASRFAEFLINHVRRGLAAKDKTVRFRCCQLLSAILNHMGEISDDLFATVHHDLALRLNDKETYVRLHAVLGLSRLQSDDEEGNDTTRLLVSALQHDPAAEVRRAVLLNLQKSRRLLPYLLERAWDVSATNRRCVYSKVMKEIADFRLLSIGMREKMLQWGLQDRDSQVKAAATKMFVNSWLQAANSDLVELLERLDVLNSKVAETALRVFFDSRRDVLHKLEFVDEFWHSLSSESALLARVFVEFCQSDKDTNLRELADARMPELTKLAFLTEKYLGLLKVSQDEHEDHVADPELEFIVEQLFALIATYDFSDEIGRRKTLGLLRQAITGMALAEPLIQRALVVVSKIAINDRDLSQIAIELISDIRDEVEPDTPAPTSADDAEEGDSFHTAASASTPKPVEDDGSGTIKSEQELVVLLKCLAVLQGTLEILSSPLESTPALMALVDSLVIPAVRNHEPRVRERGIRCLGLCSLLSKTLAMQNMLVFGQCYTRGDENLKLEAVRIIADVLTVHGTSVLDVDGSVDSLSIYKLFYKAVRNDPSPALQGEATEAICKLLLHGVFIEEDVSPVQASCHSSVLTQLVKVLVMVYFKGGDSNERVQQTLAYCLPVYSYSSVENQRRLSSVVVDSVRRFTLVYGTDEASESMVTPTQMLGQLIDWTDPRKVVGRVDDPDTSVHRALARDMILRLASAEAKDEIRALTSGFSKLTLFPGPMADGSESALLLADVHREVKELVEYANGLDTVSTNALRKFATALARVAAPADADAPAFSSANTSFTSTASVVEPSVA